MVLATLNQATTFTVYGSNLPTTLAFWVDACTNVTKLSNATTQVKFRCTPSYSTGSKSGIIKDKSGGATLKSFSVQVRN